MQRVRSEPQSYSPLGREPCLPCSLARVAAERRSALGATHGRLAAWPSACAPKHQRALSHTKSPISTLACSSRTVQRSLAAWPFRGTRGCYKRRLNRVCAALNGGITPSGMRGKQPRPTMALQTARVWYPLEVDPPQRAASLLFLVLVTGFRCRAIARHGLSSALLVNKRFGKEISSGSRGDSRTPAGTPLMASTIQDSGMATRVLRQQALRTPWGRSWLAISLM